MESVEWEEDDDIVCLEQLIVRAQAQIVALRRARTTPLDWPQIVRELVDAGLLDKEPGCGSP